MAKINSYPQVIPTNDDLILGTDVNQADRPTKNFKVSDLIALVTGGATGLGAVISLNSSAKDPITPFTNQSATDFLNISGTGTVTFTSLTDGTFNTTGGATTTTTLTTTGNITSNATVQADTFQTTAGVATWTTTVLAGFTSITTDALVVNGAVSGTSLIIATDLAGATNANIASTLAIKTYVDDKVANLDTLSELLAKNPSPAVNPSNTTGGTDIDVSSTDDINLTWDSTGSVGAKIFGAGESVAGAAQLEQLQVYAEGANSYINHTGSPAGVGADGLYIRSSDSIILTAQTGGEKRAEFINNGAVDLYHDGNKKFETSSTGVIITGTVSAAIGTKELPSYTFTGDVDTGMFHPAEHEIGFSTEQALRLKISNSGINVTGSIDATGLIEGLSFTTDTTLLKTPMTRFVKSTDPSDPVTNPATAGIFAANLQVDTMIPTVLAVKTYVDTVAGNKVLKYQADAAATGTMPFELNLSTDSLDIAGGTNMNTSTLAVTAGNLGVVTVNLDDNVTLPVGSGKGTYTGTKYTDGTMSIEAGVGTDFISITTSPNSSQPPGAVNANGFFGPLRASASSTNITAGVADQAVKLVDIGRASVANDIQLYPTFSLSTNEVVASNATAIVLASIPINNQTPIIGQALTGTDVVADTLITNVQVNTPTNKVTITVDKQQTSGIAASTSLTFTTSAPIYTSGGNATIPTFLPNTVATSKLLTGLSTGVSSSILSSDTILGGMEKLQAQISATTGLSYEGLWNATTDSPALSGTTPASGVFYIVNVAGNTNLSGITDWLVGDWAIYVSNGSATDGWQKLDQTSEITGGGGSAGDMAMFTSAQNIAPSIINQTGSAGSFAVSLGSNADLEVTGNTQLGDSDSDTTLVKGSLTAEKNVIIKEGLGVPIAGPATSYGIDGQALFSGNAADSTVSSNANVWTTVAWNLSADSGNKVVANGNTVTLSGGDGIETSESSGIVTTAIRYADSDAAGTKKNAIEIAGDATPVLTDKFWFSDANANTNINEIKKASISAIKTLTAQSWTLGADTGTPQVIVDTGIVDIAGGTIISTVAGSSNKVTINHDAVTVTQTDSTGSPETPAFGGFFDFVSSASGTTQGHMDTVVTKRVTLPSLPTLDNYQYWTLSDGTTTVNISSTNTAKVVGGTGITSAVSTTDKSVTLDFDGTFPAAHGTQYSLPLWDTATTLGDSQISQNSGATEITTATSFKVSGKNLSVGGGTTKGLTVGGGGPTKAGFNFGTSSPTNNNDFVAQQGIHYSGRLGANSTAKVMATVADLSATADIFGIAARVYITSGFPNNSSDATVKTARIYDVACLSGQAPVFNKVIDSGYVGTGTLDVDFAAYTDGAATPKRGFTMSFTTNSGTNSFFYITIEMLSARRASIVYPVA